MILHSYMFALLMWLALLLKTFPKKCSPRVVQFVEVMSRKIHSQEMPSNNTNRIPSSITLYFHVCLLKLSQPFKPFEKLRRLKNLPTRRGVSGWWCFRMWYGGDIRHPLGKLVPGSHRTIHGKLPRCLYKSNHWIVPLTSTTIPLLQGKEFLEPKRL